MYLLNSFERIHWRFLKCCSHFDYYKARKGRPAVDHPLQCSMAYSCKASNIQIVGTWMRMIGSLCKMKKYTNWNSILWFFVFLSFFLQQRMDAKLVDGYVVKKECFLLHGTEEAICSSLLEEVSKIKRHRKYNIQMIILTGSRERAFLSCLA